MLAGVIFGPNTPGIALVDDPHSLELLAALGLILLLFHLGLEFSLGELLAGGRSLLTIGAIYLALNIGGGLAFGFALGWGSQRSTGDRGRDRHLVVGHRDEAAHRAAPAREPGEPADPRHHRRRGRVPRAVPRGAAAGAREGRRTARRAGPVRDRAGVPPRDDRARALRLADRRPADRHARRRAADGLLRRPRRARRRRRRGAGRVRRDRRVHDRARAGGDAGVAPHRAAGAAAARRVRGGVLLRVRSDHRPERRGQGDRAGARSPWSSRWC